MSILADAINRDFLRANKNASIRFSYHNDDNEYIRDDIIDIDDPHYAELMTSPFLKYIFMYRYEGNKLVLAGSYMLIMGRNFLDNGIEHVQGKELYQYLNDNLIRAFGRAIYVRNEQ